ncbi:MAG: hypothetical protein ACPGVO_03475 [Spirulinaceae cyanobacterium]
MVALIAKLSFADFLDCCPEDGHYELVNGEMVKVEPIRAHKNVSRFLVKQFDQQSDRLHRC